MEKAKNVEKKKNIWVYFIKALLLFFLIYMFHQLSVVILNNSFKFLKYGPEIIMEAIWAVLVLIVLLLFKNSYIFTGKKEKGFKSLKYGWPLIAISLILLVLSIINIGFKFEIPVLLNLATYCLLIGITEEFLCRGWLLNEFLERFSDSKKNVILSMIFSSFIFGIMHITNIFIGQSLADTIIQILNATLLGLIFALIYYKTKNIWTVVFIHAFWDFCLMMPESINLTDCITGTVTNTILTFNFISAIVIIISLLLMMYWLIKQTELSNQSKKLTKVTYWILPIISIILYTGIATITPDGYDEYYICPKYNYKDIGNEYEIQYYHHELYSLKYSKEIEIIDNKTINSQLSDKQNQENNINNPTKRIENFNFVLSKNKKTNEIKLQNTYTKKEIILFNGLVYDYLLLDNSDSYIILIQSDYNKVLYGLYPKEEISNDEKYLEDVKKHLKEYVVPQINQIGSVTIGESNYKYAQIQTNIYNNFYFDSTGELFIGN